MTQAFYPSIFLCGLNTDSCIQLLINKPSFTLGYAGDCDGVLSFNPQISSHHCRIHAEGGNYFITDLGSTNHTYLNGEMLVDKVKYPLFPDDRIQLATTVFLVEKIYTTPQED